MTLGMSIILLLYIFTIQSSVYDNSQREQNRYKWQEQKKKYYKDFHVMLWHKCSFEIIEIWSWRIIFI